MRFYLSSYSLEINFSSKLNFRKKNNKTFKEDNIMEINIFLNLFVGFKNNSLIIQLKLTKFEHMKHIKIGNIL